jgi:hypothetical protein
MAERRKPKLFRGIFFLGVSGVLLSISISTGMATRQFVREAAVATGVVTKLNAGGSHPDIEFTTPTGQKMSYAQGGWISGYKPGDRVRVLYRPADPHATASIDATGALWFAPGLTGLLGFAFILIGIVSIVRPDAIEIRP